jgi:predicted nucleotidyltransferase
MRRDRGARPGPLGEAFDPESVRRHFDRPVVVAVYLFGSMAEGKPHRLSDVDLAYLGTNHEAEDPVFDDLYEALQTRAGRRELRPGAAARCAAPSPVRDHDRPRQCW